MQGRRQVDCHVLEIQGSGLELREIQNVVDDPQQGVCGVTYREGALALRIRQVLIEQDTRHAHDSIHGCADLVAHHREEFGLGLSGRLCPVAGRFEFRGSLAHGEVEAKRVRLKPLVGFEELAALCLEKGFGLQARGFLTLVASA